MNTVTKKWVLLKVSSAILVPLMCWFIINFVGIFDKDYADVLGFFSTKSSKILFSLFLILAFFFSNLSISEVFDDYINDEKNKNAANKALQIFAIVVPLITIIIVFNLNI